MPLQCRSRRSCARHRTPKNPAVPMNLRGRCALAPGCTSSFLVRPMGQSTIPTTPTTQTRPSYCPTRHHLNFCRRTPWPMVLHTLPHGLAHPAPWSCTPCPMALHTLLYGLARARFKFGFDEANQGPEPAAAHSTWSCQAWNDGHVEVYT